MCTEPCFSYKSIRIQLAGPEQVTKWVERFFQSRYVSKMYSKVHLGPFFLSPDLQAIVIKITYHAYPSSEGTAPSRVSAAFVTEIPPGGPKQVNLNGLEESTWLWKPISRLVFHLIVTKDTWRQSYLLLEIWSKNLLEGLVQNQGGPETRRKPTESGTERQKPRCYTDRERLEWTSTDSASWKRNNTHWALVPLKRVLL